ncbi:MAG: DUF2256 and DUF3253 domain-containing protein [Acidimicrobiales bacterium]
MSRDAGRSAPVKVCASCGREMVWRKAWAKNWDEVKYCSEACRRRKIGPADTALENAIVELLDQRANGATICPSEAARLVDPVGWRELMTPVRSAANRLVANGQIEIVQRGRVVDPSSAKGPIRLRRARARP